MGTLAELGARRGLCATCYASCIAVPESLATVSPIHIYPNGDTLFCQCCYEGHNVVGIRGADGRPRITAVFSIKPLL